MAVPGHRASHTIEHDGRFTRVDARPYRAARGEWTRLVCGCYTVVYCCYGHEGCLHHCIDPMRHLVAGYWCAHTMFAWDKKCRRRHPVTDGAPGVILRPMDFGMWKKDIEAALRKPQRQPT